MPAERSPRPLPAPSQPLVVLFPLLAHLLAFASGNEKRTPPHPLAARFRPPPLPSVHVLSSFAFCSEPEFRNVMAEYCIRGQYCRDKSSIGCHIIKISFVNNGRVRFSRRALFETVKFVDFFIVRQECQSISFFF